MTTTSTGPVISAWAAVSPFGIGRDAFVDGLAAGVGTATAVDTDVWPVPDTRACLVPAFDIVEQLGRKGTRSMDRVTGLAVTTVGQLVDGPGDGVALVLGTTTGSAQSIMDFTRDSLVAEKPFFVDPARFPNTVMNSATGRCAIRFGLTGPNTTVAGGRVSGLHALTYARRLLDSGRADTVLCGAVEEYSTERSWLEWHSRGPDEPDTVLGEGGVVVRLERPGPVPRPALAQILAVRCGVVVGDDVRPALHRCVRGALMAAGVSATDVWAALPGGAAGSDHEAEVLAGFLPDAATVLPGVTSLIGDTSAAAATFQLAVALALARDTPDAAGRVVLLTSTDRSGGVGCAVLRLGSPELGSVDAGPVGAP
ncbi:beta-ketoacyl synthase N-terminal-like domain-containing protein [Virgisporangium ochraceum]|uniref:3-oxoacyl-ACP synthase n=1 Tax=Virgisporangium ochraceum TaxID=65505 RepID=A0A8J4A4J2_9ACTN|nr:beta-ketoacyl synthase N-terminal-like domain-containing protein [Virgisporangium ochraceum]GIJ75559.1 3-oxoacyl-ACP synthase [Virgisporangium ochraceum]